MQKQYFGSVSDTPQNFCHHTCDLRVGQQKLNNCTDQKFLIGYRGKVLTDALSLNQLDTDIFDIFS